MTETADTKPGVLFWGVAIVLLLWGFATTWIYVSYFLETPAEFAATAEIPANQAGYAAYIAGIPWWAIGAGILAALTRVAGAVGLLARRGWALPVYVVSLACFGIALFRAFVLADAAAVMSPQHISTEVLFVALGVFAIWFGRANRRRGVLR